MKAQAHDGSTRTVAIFGWPLSYTLSPTFQNAGLAARGIQAAYLPLPVQNGADFKALASALMRSPAFVGANITNPHKALALKLAKPSPQAKRIGAANLLYRQGSSWRAHNTDGEGLLLALRRELGLSPKGKRVTVLGAGGAAAAVVWALASQGAQVTVLARRLSQGRALARRFGKAVKAGKLIVSRLNKELYEQDWVINTVPGVAFARQAGKALRDLPTPDARVAIDISYVPALTPFLAAAAREEWTIMNGLPMLLAQGELSFACWFGGKVPSQAMAEALASAG